MLLRIGVILIWPPALFWVLASIPESNEFIEMEKVTIDQVVKAHDQCIKDLSIDGWFYKDSVFRALSSNPEAANDICMFLMNNG